MQNHQGKVSSLKSFDNILLKNNFRIKRAGMKIEEKIWEDQTMHFSSKEKLR